MIRKGRIAAAVLAGCGFAVFLATVWCAFVGRLAEKIESSGQVIRGDDPLSDALFDSVGFWHAGSARLGALLLACLGALLVVDLVRTLAGLGGRKSECALDAALVAAHAWLFFGDLLASASIGLPVFATACVALLGFLRVLMLLTSSGEGEVEVVPAGGRPAPGGGAAWLLVPLLVPVVLAATELLLPGVGPRVGYGLDAGNLGLFYMGNALAIGLLLAGGGLALFLLAQLASKLLDNERRSFPAGACCAYAFALIAYGVVPGVLAIPAEYWAYMRNFGIVGLFFCMLISLGMGAVLCVGLGLLRLRQVERRPLHQVQRRKIFIPLLGYGSYPLLGLYWFVRGRSPERFGSVVLLVGAIANALGVVWMTGDTIYNRYGDFVTRGTPMFATMLMMAATLIVTCLVLLAGDLNFVRSRVRVPAWASGGVLAAIVLLALATPVVGAARVTNRSEVGGVVRRYGPMGGTHVNLLDRLRQWFMDPDPLVELGETDNFAFHGPDAFATGSRLERYQGGNRPNIFLICADSLRADHLPMPPFNYERDTTPRLAAFAGEKDVITFGRAFSASDATLCSTRSVFSGMHVYRGPGTPPNAPKRLSSYLAAAGYKKFALYLPTHTTHEVTAKEFNRGAGNGEGTRRETYNAFSYDRKRGDKEEAWAKVRDKILAQNMLTAIDKVRAGTTEPVYASIHLMQPHFPWHRGRKSMGYDPSKKEFDDWTPKQRYDHTIGRFDATFADILDGLKERRLYKNSIIIVYADHGLSLAEHRWKPGMLAGLWQEGVHIPLLIKVPGATKAVVNTPVSLVDIVPTLCELTGVPARSREPFHGISLAPMILPDLRTPAKRTKLFTMRNFHDAFGLLDEGRWKFLYNRQFNTFALYDLEKDPGERWNLYYPGERWKLYPDLPGRRRRYKAWLGSFLREGKGSYAENP